MISNSYKPILWSQWNIVNILYVETTKLWNSYWQIGVILNVMSETIQKDMSVMLIKAARYWEKLTKRWVF